MTGSQAYHTKIDSQTLSYNSRRQRNDPGRFIYRPDWSPDGTRLAFGADEDDDGMISVLLINVATGQAQHLIQDGNSPAWSPDGQRLIYKPAGDRQILYVADSSGNPLYQLTGSDYNAWSPDWAPGVAAVAAPPAQGGPAVSQCAVAPAEKFRSFWQQYRAALGCPRGQLVEDGGATERFQRGRMIWRKDNDMIYVLYDEGDWLGTPDTSVDGAPEPGGYQPPAGLFTPVRGFGVTWRDRLGGPSARIGWATEQEYWLPMQFQDFERGLMLEMEGKIYLLGDHGGRWFTQP